MANRYIIRRIMYGVCQVRNMNLTVFLLYFVIVSANTKNKNAWHYQLDQLHANGDHELTVRLPLSYCKINTSASNGFTI